MHILVQSFAYLISAYRQLATAVLLLQDLAVIEDSRDSASEGFAFQNLRSLLPLLPTEELAIAGQATALLQWHAVCYLHYLLDLWPI